MTIVQLIITIIGALCVLRFLLTIGEAILYGVLGTWQHILACGMRSFRLHYWWWLIKNPWVLAYSRLFGNDAYTSESTLCGWTHIPPFKLYRANKPNCSAGHEPKDNH